MFHDTVFAFCVAFYLLHFNKKISRKLFVITKFLYNSSVITRLPIPVDAIYLHFLSFAVVVS